MSICVNTVANENGILNDRIQKISGESLAELCNLKNSGRIMEIYKTLRLPSPDKMMEALCIKGA